MVEIAFINFGVVNFYLQIFSIFLMFCLKHERRKLWLLRLSLPTLCGLVFFFLFPRWMPFEGWNLSFLCIFVLNMAAVKFSFSIRWRQIVIYGIAAATMQNLVAKFVTIFFSLGSPVLWERTLIQLLINDVLFVFACAALWKLFIWQKGEGGVKIDNVRFAILLSVTVANVFVLSYLCDMLVFADAARVLCVCLLIIVDMMVLCAEFGVFEKSKLQQENETIEKMLYLQNMQRKSFETSVDLINRKCHDIRHQLALLRKGSGQSNAKYIEEMEKELAGYELNVKTGNDALDIVLTEYSLRCKKEGVRFTYMADGEALAFMDASDLYSFFGNALENAVEALAREEDEEKRLLEVLAERRQGVVRVKIENYFAGSIAMEKDLPRTTKEDNGFHGYGLKSIRYITEKYDGDLRLSVQDQKFILQAIFPGR